MSGPVRSLDISELRAFCAAVDLGSLGRAARLLRVSQPALSKRMRTIETVVGTPLVERSRRGERLVDAVVQARLERAVRHHVGDDQCDECDRADREQQPESETQADSRNE